MITGIGVLLVLVSAVAWRLTNQDYCSSFFGFTGISGRIPPTRPIHPYAAMIYPEFQFRTPPPSYQVKKMSVLNRARLHQRALTTTCVAIHSVLLFRRLVCKSTDFDCCCWTVCSLRHRHHRLIDRMREASWWLLVRRERVDRRVTAPNPMLRRTRL